ncbi:hypothetical protein [Lysobacter capsici]|uniref:hypothetical protein n=1 Tax=Lysobacter capsici TaxID=435897 RepID=UPI001C004A14|nr:hypothetical protein [Lysobacter capsici]QWF19587.1 hypothetical protein KME82_12990 [Lysobacter capsici]
MSAIEKSRQRMKHRINLSARWRDIGPRHKRLIDPPQRNIFTRSIFRRSRRDILARQDQSTPSAIDTTLWPPCHFVIEHL